MQGRNDEVPGFRRLQGCQRGFVIPDLANKNDVGRLTKRASQPGCKADGVPSNMSLSKMTAIAGELILDRILDRHDVPHQVLVHPLKERRDSGGFPGASWPRHKDQAVLTSAPSGQKPL